jgi:hypothetical protein
VKFAPEFAPQGWQKPARLENKGKENCKYKNDCQSLYESIGKKEKG